MGKHLPFYARFHLPILERKKRFTLRNECYGQPGEIIPSDVGPLRILSVRPATPAWVRDNLWADEGCASADDFEKVWRQIHPNKPDMDRPRWLHEFEPVGLFDPGLPNAKPEWAAETSDTADQRLACSECDWADWSGAHSHDLPLPRNIKEAKK